MPVYIYNGENGVPTVRRTDSILFQQRSQSQTPPIQPENPELYILKPMFKASFPYFKTISSRFLAGFKQLNAEVRVPEMVWVVVCVFYRPRVRLSYLPQLL